MIKNVTLIIGIDNIKESDIYRSYIKGVDYTVVDKQLIEYDIEDLEIELKHNKELENKIIKALKKYGYLCIVNIKYDLLSSQHYIDDYVGVIFEDRKEKYFIDCMENDFRVYSSVAFSDNGKCLGIFK